MTCLNIEKIDRETLQRLQNRAKRHNATLEEEVLSILRLAVASNPPSKIRKVRAGDLATSLFGSEYGVELKLPERIPHNPMDFGE